MPFGFKLSHRLSRIKCRAVMTSIAAAAVVAACQTDRIGPGSEKLVASVVITPDSISLDPQQTQQFHVFGRTPAGESTAVAVTWSASVGTITPNGLFTADTTSDDAIVTATLTSSGVTATTRIRKRRVVAVVLTPAAVTMPPGSTAQFVAYGMRNIGDSTSVADPAFQGRSGGVVVGRASADALATTRQDRISGSGNVIAVERTAVWDTVE